MDVKRVLKIIGWGVVGIGVLSVLVVTIWTVTSGNSMNTKAKAGIESVSLSLNPKSAVLNKNQNITFGITVNGGNKITKGIDVYIQFDPSYWNISDKGIIPAKLFDKVLINSIDETKGVIKFSALSTKAEIKTGIVGSFSLTPIKSGKTTITFRRSETDLLEAETIRDVLTELGNSEVEIR